MYIAGPPGKRGVVGKLLRILIIPSFPAKLKYLDPGPFIPKNVKELVWLKRLHIYGSKRGLVRNIDHSYHAMCLLCTLPVQKLNYVMDVLVPEVIVKLIMDETGLEHEQVNTISGDAKLN